MMKNLARFYKYKKKLLAICYLRKDGKKLSLGFVKLEAESKASLSNAVKAPSSRFESFKAHRSFQFPSS